MCHCYIIVICCQWMEFPFTTICARIKHNLISFDVFIGEHLEQFNLSCGLFFLQVDTFMSSWVLAFSVFLLFFFSSLCLYLLLRLTRHSIEIECGPYCSVCCRVELCARHSSPLLSCMLFYFLNLSHLIHCHRCYQNNQRRKSM